MPAAPDTQLPPGTSVEQSSRRTSELEKQLGEIHARLPQVESPFYATQRTYGFGWYFTSSPLERANNGRAFELLGTHLFLRHLAPKMPLPKGSADDTDLTGALTKHRNFTIWNEKISLVLAAGGGLALALSCSHPSLAMSAVLGAATMTFGVFPILGSRYQRARIDNILSNRAARRAPEQDARSVEG